MSRYERFDRSQVELWDLAKRGHELRAEDCLPPVPPEKPFAHADFGHFVGRIVAARHAGRPVILMMGSQPIKLGLSRFLVDLIERHWITHLATTGEGMIHDFELTCFGGTNENVAHWIAAGQYGLWRQTGALNDLAMQAAASGHGLGETLGQWIEERRPPHAALSLAAAGFRPGCR